MDIYLPDAGNCAISKPNLQQFYVAKCEESNTK